MFHQVHNNFTEAYETLLGVIHTGQEQLQSNKMVKDVHVAHRKAIKNCPLISLQMQVSLGTHPKSYI